MKSAPSDHDASGSAPRHPNGPVTRHVEVGPDQDGERLDTFLAGALPDRSRSQLQKLIKDGHLRVEDGRAGTREGGKTLRASTLVKAGQRFTIELPEPEPATAGAEDLPLTILYEDNDLVVIDKPAGMVVHPAAGHSSGTVVNALLYHVEDLSGVGGELRPGIVHRLDRGTSGLMVVAKNDRAHDELSRQFREREVEKEYIALV